MDMDPRCPVLGQDALIPWPGPCLAIRRWSAGISEGPPSDLPFSCESDRALLSLTLTATVLFTSLGKEVEYSYPPGVVPGSMTARS